MKLKVCGMKSNTSEVAKMQPDYLGFIFYNNSPRDFDDNIPELPNSIKKTGVFVDEKVEIIVAKIEKYNLDAIQLHGCLLYTSPSPRDRQKSRMPSSA